MQNTENALTRFRAALYATGLGKRKDSLFDLLDAALTADGPATLARLSLAPGFRRRWPRLMRPAGQRACRC